ASDNLRLSSPAAYTSVQSPLDLSGESTAFEGQVEAQVRQDGQVAGQWIGRTSYVGGGNGTFAPFHVSMVYDPPAERAGAVILETISPRDGSVAEATVVRV